MTRIFLLTLALAAAVATGLFTHFARSGEATEPAGGEVALEEREAVPTDERREPAARM